jgi:hypothetical protein
MTDEADAGYGRGPTGALRRRAAGAAAEKLLPDASRYASS